MKYIDYFVSLFTDEIGLQFLFVWYPCQISALRQYWLCQLRSLQPFSIFK